jgi:hypothetical protein
VSFFIGSDAATNGAQSGKRKKALHRKTNRIVLFEGTGNIDFSIKKATKAHWQTAAAFVAYVANHLQIRAVPSRRVFYPYRKSVEFSQVLLAIKQLFR